MTQIAFANLNRAEVAPRLALKGGGRRRLDRLIAARTKHLAGKPYLVSVHRPGEIFAPTDDSVRLAAVPADAEAHEVPLYEERLWSRTYVAPGDIVLITILPQGGGGSQSGAKIGLMVASIALFAFAAWAGPAVFASGGLLPIAGTPGAIAGKILTAGIMIGGNAILSAFARQGNPNNKLYGVSGGGNLARPNERIPVGFGRFWNAPDLSQPDYFSYAGDDMTLFKRMTIGCGKYEIMEIRAGQTTLWRASGSSGLPNGGPSASGVTTPFAGTTVEIIHGQASSLVPGDVLTSSNVSGITLPLSNDPNPIAGPFRVTAPGVKVGRLQVDYSYPSGYFKSNTGTTLPIDLIIEYAECDDSGAVIGAWHDLYREANGGLKVMGPKRFTRTRDVPLAQYVVRARNNVFRFSPDQEANFQRDISWDALRGHRPDSRIRTGITELCMKVQSGKSLTSTSFADIQVKARRLGQVWNGSAFVEGELRKCVDIYADLLINDDYGGGIDPNLVDLAKIRAYQTDVSEFDTFDGVIRGPDTLWGACKTVLANVRAEPVRIGPGYSFVRDEPKAIRRHTFSRRQILRGSTSIDYDVQADDGSAHVQIAYHDETDPKRPNYAEQYYGTASAFGPRRIEWPGLSSYAHAVHIARWLAASGFYRRARVSFDTELAGRLVFRGDPIAVDPWFLDGRAVSGVLAAADTTLLLDADVAVVSGDYAMLRDRGGEEWGPVRVVQGTSPREVILNADDVAAEAASSGLTLVQVLAPENANPTTIIIGSLVEHGEQWLVESMVPKEKGQASLSAKLDSPAVYAAIGAVIPPDSPITWPLVTVESPAIRNFTAAIRQHTSSLELQFSILASAGATLFEVEVSQDGQDYTQFYSGASASGTGPIRYSDTDILVRARAYGATGVPGEWTAPFALVVPKPVVTATGVDPGVIGYEALDDAIRAGGVMVSQQQDARDAMIESLAQQVTELSSVVTALGKSQTRRLVSIQGQASARLTEFQQVVADPVTGYAKATNLLALSAQVNDPIAGLPKTRADFSSFASTQADYNSATTTSLDAVTATADGVSASGAISFVAKAGTSGYSTFYQVKLAAAGLSTAIRLTVTSGGEAGFDVITKWFRLINPATDAVSGYFDVVQSRFVLDTIEVRNAVITGRVISDLGLRVDAKLRFGNRYYGNNQTRFHGRQWNPGTGTKTFAWRLRRTVENRLEVWTFGSPDRLIAAFDITPTKNFPDTATGYLEFTNFSPNGICRLWPDGQLEIGDYNASNWVPLWSKSPAFPNFEMDPLNALNDRKFICDVPTTLVAPAGCTTMTVKAWGAGGNSGDGSSGGQGRGGTGGYGSFNLPVVPGEAYRITVPIDSQWLGAYYTDTGPTAQYSFMALYGRLSGFSSMTGFGGPGLGNLFNGTRERWQMAFGGGGAAIVSKGPPVLGDGSIIAVIPGGGGAIGPYHGYPGGYVGGSGGNVGSMFGRPGQHDATSCWTGGGGGYEGGGYAPNAGPFGAATNCYRGLGGTFYFSPACTGVVQMVGTYGSATAPNAGDADYVAFNAANNSLNFGYGGFSSISGTISPGGQGLVIVTFS